MVTCDELVCSCWGYGAPYSGGGGIWVFEWSSEKNPKNMNFVLMYNGENKTLLSIRIWVTNLFTLSGSTNPPSAFRSLKRPTRMWKYFSFLLNYWYCGIQSDKRPDSPGPKSRPTTSLSLGKWLWVRNSLQYLLRNRTLTHFLFGKVNDQLCIFLEIATIWNKKKPKHIIIDCYVICFFFERKK